MTRPLFWLVQGTDFGRSNKWAKSQPNLGVRIREACMKARKQL